jgi:hypothetical protein
MPWQHCASVEQTWPYSAQAAAPVQVPIRAPSAIAQVRPAQQSEPVVHVPFDVTHAGRQRLLTQGWPQQSALVAQIVPAATGAVHACARTRQRPLPVASGRQHSSGFELQLAPAGSPAGSQQSLVRLQVSVGSLQRFPASLHEVFPPQRP